MTDTAASVPAPRDPHLRALANCIRFLSMDAVQKGGNGHPGTAMSLAPLAYTLFQRTMRHDPSDVHWLGRDRFIHCETTAAGEADGQCGQTVVVAGDAAAFGGEGGVGPLQDGQAALDGDLGPADPTDFNNLRSRLEALLPGSFELCG